jgi:hypothetical protein
MTPFSIELTRAKFEAGAFVTGAVVFEEKLDELEKARGVRLQVTMNVTGSGNSEKLEVYDEMLHLGPVHAPLKLPFRAALPRNGPCSFEGRHVKINWSVRVSADVAWAIDPKAVEQFEVIPASAAHQG